MICPYCGKEYDFWMTHARCCSKYKEYKQKVLSKEYLKQEYIKNERSVKDIANTVGLSYGVIKRALQSHDIHIRDSHETRFSKGYIENTKATCRAKFGSDYANCKHSNIFGKAEQAILEKHGVRNNFQTEHSKQKAKQTLLEKYGVENCSQSNEVRQKVRNTCLERYGYENVAQVPEFIAKQKLSKHKQNSSCYNSPTANLFFSKLLEKIQDNDHIYCAIKGHEYCIMTETKELYFYDFVDTQKRKCIEFNGNYWHANPKLYENTWINPHTQKTAQEIWEKDNKKIDAIKQNRGYDVLVVWELEVKQDLEQCLQNCLKFLQS